MANDVLAILRESHLGEEMIAVDMNMRIVNAIMELAFAINAATNKPVQTIKVGQLIFREMLREVKAQDAFHQSSEIGLHGMIIKADNSLSGVTFEEEPPKLSIALTQAEKDNLVRHSTAKMEAAVGEMSKWPTPDSYDPAEDVKLLSNHRLVNFPEVEVALCRLIVHQQKTISELSDWARRVESGNRYQRASEKKGAK